MKTVALIPAREGSKSIVNKNIQKVNNVPIVVRAIQTSLSAGLQEVWVSSDSAIIRAIANSYLSKALERPAAISGDTATTEEAIAHFLENVDCDTVVLVQATSALLSPKSLQEGLQKYYEKGYDSLFSATLAEDFLIWNQKEMTPINYELSNRGRRQEREPLLIETGGFYIFSRESFMKSGLRLSGKIGFSLVPFWEQFEIDTKEDLEAIRRLGAK